MYPFVPMGDSSHATPLALQAVLVYVAVLALWQVCAPQVSAAEPSCCGSISSAGRRLEAVLDGMNVESLWLAHEHVNWETGEPDKNADYAGPGRSMHCSAFAAAVGKKLGVYNVASA